MLNSLERGQSPAAPQYIASRLPGTRSRGPDPFGQVSDVPGQHERTPFRLPDASGQLNGEFRPVPEQAVRPCRRAGQVSDTSGHLEDTSFQLSDDSGQLPDYSGQLSDSFGQLSETIRIGPCPGRGERERGRG